MLRRKVFSKNSGARVWGRRSYPDEIKVQALEGLGYQARCPGQKLAKDHKTHILFTEWNHHMISEGCSKSSRAKTQEQTRWVARVT